MPTDGSDVKVKITTRVEKFDGEWAPGKVPVEIIEREEEVNASDLPPGMLPPVQKGQ